MAFLGDDVIKMFVKMGLVHENTTEIRISIRPGEFVMFSTEGICPPEMFKALNDLGENMSKGKGVVS